MVDCVVRARVLAIRSVQKQRCDGRRRPRGRGRVRRAGRLRKVSPCGRARALLLAEDARERRHARRTSRSALRARVVVDERRLAADEPGEGEFVLVRGLALLAVECRARGLGDRHRRGTAIERGARHGGCGYHDEGGTSADTLVMCAPWTKTPLPPRRVTQDTLGAAAQQL
jgi:hypothetical protein